MLILSYILLDDPCNEREMVVASISDARRVLDKVEDLIEWAVLTDSNGEEIPL